MFKRFKKHFFILFLSSLFFIFSFGLTQAKLEVNYPTIFGQTINSETTFPQYIKYVFNFAVSISGLILLGILIWSGFIYLISTGDPIKTKEARDKIGSAFLGVIILLSGYLILTFINPSLSAIKLPSIEKLNIGQEKYISNPEKCKPNKLSTIAYEIPIGNLVEDLFKQKIKKDNKKMEAINLLQATVISFKKFLNEKIKINSEEFTHISDLNKYLKKLSEDCHCADTKAICQKPTNFAVPVGCVGDPCVKVREKINKALDEDNKKFNKLLAYKEEFSEIKDSFEDEGRKFRQIMDVFEKCKNQDLFNRKEFYENLSIAEKQKGTVKIIKSYVPAGTDPSTFYCVVGGSVFDSPYIPQEKQPPLKEPINNFPVKEETPISCPIYIPSGEEIIDPAREISYKINRDIENTIYYTDKLAAGISKMEELISHCNRQHCDVNCSCIYNPCYMCCSVIPCGGCVPFCKSPCLQAVGECYGEPCGDEGRKKIGEMSERIKIYEDKIFYLLDELQGYIKDSDFLLNNFDLGTIKEGLHICMMLGPKQNFLEKPQKEPFWELVNCEKAIGYKGPNGDIINECNPQSFYCCASKPFNQNLFPTILSNPFPLNSSYLFEEAYRKSGSGYNEVPYFSQNNPLWKNKYFGCGTTIGSAGSSSASLAMVLNYFKATGPIKADPIIVSKLILDKNYRDCNTGFKKDFICNVIKILGENNIKCEKTGVKEILNGLKNKKIAIIKTRSIPPYPIGGHYVVLTGIKKRWGEDFIYYNDPSYNINLLQKGKKYIEKPADWLTKKGILEGYLISK